MAELYWSWQGEEAPKAVERYEARYGRRPDVAYIHPGAPLATVDGLELVELTTVPAGYIYIGPPVLDGTQRANEWKAEEPAPFATTAPADVPVAEAPAQFATMAPAEELKAEAHAQIATTAPADVPVAEGQLEFRF
jgi:hypothetical protein